MSDKDGEGLHRIVGTAAALTTMALVIYNAVPGTRPLAGYVLIIFVSFVLTVLLDRLVAHRIQIINTVIGWFGKHSHPVIGVLVTLGTCYAAYRLTESLLISLLILLQNAGLLWLARNYVQRLTPTAPPARRSY